MKKILIVEDDSDIREALSIRLKASGYDVVVAEDALQGMLTAVREMPDLMILDISMPAGDGFSIVERLRANTEMPVVPTIYITASKQSELRRRARDLDAYAFFEKPYQATDLLQVVEEALTAESTLTSK